MTCAIWAFVFLVCGVDVQAQIDVSIERKGSGADGPKFQFAEIAAPARDDAGVVADYTLLSGFQDGNGGPTKVLQDGSLPTNRDQPSKNWFLSGRGTGRLLVDFGRPIDLREIRTYSWHRNARADQVYDVYLPRDADGDPAVVASQAAGRGWRAHWRSIATVDTRDSRSSATQIAVSIAEQGKGVIAKTRYALLVIRPTSAERASSQTFFSEIDFIDGRQYDPPPMPPDLVDTLRIKGIATIRFDTTETPSLRPWVTETLMPACEAWYPRIVKALPSDGYRAPNSFKIVFREGMRGVAYTSGKDVYCAGPWYRRNLKGEATGSVIHELVHVVQQYGRSGGKRPPGWLVEGIADHIRWYQYEPIGKRRRLNWDASNYDDAYFPSATFLDYIVRKLDEDAIRRINADARKGLIGDRYFWKQYGKSASEIWRAAREEATQSRTSGNPLFKGWYADPEAMEFDEEY